MKFNTFIGLIGLLMIQQVMGQRDSLYYTQVLDSGYQLEQTAPRKALLLYAKTANEAGEDQNHFVSNKVHLYSGLVMSGLGKYDSARYYYKLALPFAQKLIDKGLEASVYINMANSYQYESDFENAIKYYQKGIEFYGKINDREKLAISYQNLASVFSNMEDFERVRFYLEKALSHALPEDLYRKALIYNDMALCFLAQGELEDCLGTLQQSEELVNELEDDGLLYFMHQNYGEYYTMMGNYDSAIESNTKALVYAKELTEFSSNYYLIDTSRRLGTLYGLNGQKQTGERFLLDALQRARETGTHVMEEEVYVALANLEKTKNPLKALDYLDRAKKLGDSLHRVTYSNKVLELDKRFELAQKDQEILEQKLKIEEQEVVSLRQQSKLSMAMSGVVLVILIGISGIFYYWQRQRQKEKQLLMEHALSQKVALIQGEENERNRVARDLHDGLNGDLCAIKYLLTDYLKSNTDRNDPLIVEAVKLLDASNKAVRNIATNLAPPAVAHFGFTEAVREYCTMQAKTHDTNIDFSVYGESKKMDENAEIQLYRIIQELINNSLKHAHATEILVQLNFDDSGLQITVEDNGVGFEKDKVTAGNGLKNIEYRLGYLNASMHFESSQSGTSYYIVKND